jgi:hypothetical protein
MFLLQKALAKPALPGWRARRALAIDKADNMPAGSDPILL